MLSEESINKQIALLEQQRVTLVRQLTIIEGNIAALRLVVEKTDEEVLEMMKGKQP